jgi:hypothetical protein
MKRVLLVVMMAFILLPYDVASSYLQVSDSGLIEVISRKCIGWSEENRASFPHENRCLDRDLNQAPPEYKSRSASLRQLARARHDID